MKQSKYDAILYIDSQSLINEDERMVATRAGSGAQGGGTAGLNYNSDDPKLWASNAYGKSMQNELSSLGRGFSAEVTDFGKWVTVRVSHHDFVSGRTSSKTFLIVFKPKGTGIIMNTANKWRTVSGYGQAISYIKSVCNTLQSNTSTKI